MNYASVRKSVKFRVFKALTLDFQYAGRKTGNLIPLQQRKFQVFCVGLPRSGTHSIANLFRKNFRADHEPFAGATVKLIEKIKMGNHTQKMIEDHFLIKDRILQLELEASHYLYRFVPLLLKLFPESKFILTVREPKSWLESEINKNYQSVKGEMWSRYENMRYGTYKKCFVNNNIKDLNGIYPVSSYLQYYVDHIDFVLRNVPEEKLLVLDTFTLKENIERICEFTGVNKNQLNLPGIHSAMRKQKKVRIHDLLEEKKLNSYIDTYCRIFIESNLPMLTKYL